MPEWYSLLATHQTKEEKATQPSFPFVCWDRNVWIPDSTKIATFEKAQAIRSKAEWSYSVWALAAVAA